MASLNDQFNMARIPLKPLAFENRTESQCDELMVDYGDNKKYHIYITHHSDSSKYIDLSNIILKEVTDGIVIDGDGITITIEGITEPQELGDLLNTIYKNYLFPEDNTGFDPDEDLEKLYLDSTINVLLTDNSGVIYLPVTTASNVYDSSGKSIEERLNGMTKLGFSIDYIYATTDNQTTFEFSYPFEDYSDFMEVRIGTTYVDKTRYQVIQEESSDGHIYGGTITFIDEYIENGRRIDLIFIFNALAGTDGTYEYIAGSQIANSTISSAKLEKTSDSYTLNDSTSIATSAALYNMYTDLVNIISENEDTTGWYFDTSTSMAQISITYTDEQLYNLMHGSASTISYYIFNVVPACNKRVTSSYITFDVAYGNAHSALRVRSLDGEYYNGKLYANKPVKLLYINSTCYILSDTNAEFTTTHYFHQCTDQETTISYSNLTYDETSIIQVYRNGLRLFEDYDYSIDTTAETITLYTRAEESETIVFEALTVTMS